MTTSETIFITHNGKFHTDELMAFSIIRYINENIKLIRTRDDDLIHKYLESNSAIVADIGKTYNPEQNNFDHHFISDEIEFWNFNMDKFENLKTPILNILYNDKNIELQNILTTRNIGIHGLKNVISKYIKYYIETNELINITIEEFFIKEYDILLKAIIYKINDSLGIDGELYKYVFDLLHNNMVEIKLQFIENIQYRKYSSAGMIWNYHGKQFIKKFLYLTKYDNIKNVEFLWKKIDATLIKDIDLDDNGLKRNYKNNNGLGNIISSYNSRNVYEAEQDEYFLKASNFLLDHLLNITNNFLGMIDDKEIFSKEFRINNYIQIFSKYINGFEKILYENGINYVKYMIYPGDNNTYNIKTIKSGIQYGEGILLPGEWLDNSPKGLLFCHTGLFLAQFDTLDNILDALYSLD